MIIGFGIDLMEGEGGEAAGLDDRKELERVGCDKIFIAAGPLSGVAEERGRILQFLRSGDTLAVVSLDRLGESLEAIIALVERLSREGVRLRAEHDGIIPGTPHGDSFTEVCRSLASVAQKLNAIKEQASSRRGQRRGRPTVLTPATRARAEKLLSDGNITVLEVARLLKVSPATIYRVLPRGSGRARGRSKAWSE
jgi:DNA invertase Pin-like site-specific DNA recombinase